MVTMLVNKGLITEFSRGEDRLNSQSIDNYTFDYSFYTEDKHIVAIGIVLYANIKGKLHRIYASEYDVTVTKHDKLSDYIWIHFDELTYLDYNTNKIQTKRFKTFIEMLVKMKESLFNNSIKAEMLESYRFTEEHNLVLTFFYMLIQLETMALTDKEAKRLHNGYRYIQTYGDILNSVDAESVIQCHLIPYKYTDKKDIIQFMDTKKNEKETMNCIMSGDYNWNITLDTYMRFLLSGK